MVSLPFQKSMRLVMTLSVDSRFFQELSLTIQQKHSSNKSYIPSMFYTIALYDSEIKFQGVMPTVSYVDGIIAVIFE
jgi:hypothetical protein